MALLLARTSTEAHLYMDLHPCECGEIAFARNSAVIEVDGELASRYTGDCPSCGRERAFTFRVPADIIFPRPGVVQFGDGTPSELLDPGEWLWVADQYAAASPADTSSLNAASLARVRQQLSAAVAAMDEVLAFVPTDGESVPPEAFRTDQGRAMHVAEPGRFYRDRLEVVRNSYRDGLAAIVDSSN